MLIKVEQKHIDNGTPGDYRSCPVVLAVKETTGAEKVTADDLTIEWGSIVNGCWKMEWMDTPMNIQIFMDNYDVGNPVKPFEFELIAEY